MPSKSTYQANRHGPNRYANYLQVHETRMQQYLRGEFVFSDGVKFAAPAGGYIVVAGENQMPRWYPGRSREEAQDPERPGGQRPRPDVRVSLQRLRSRPRESVSIR